MKGKKSLSLQELKSLEYYTPEMAVEYLRRVRGLSFSVSSLRSRRRSGRAQAKAQYTRTTLYTRSELEAMEETAWTKRVEPEKEDDPEPGSVALVRIS